MATRYHSGPVERPCAQCAKPFSIVVKRGNYPMYCVTCMADRRRLQRRAMKHVRRARMRGTAVEYINPLDVYERDGWRCGLCSHKVNPRHKYPHPRSASLDHVVPLSLGGSHRLANVQLACLACNVAKRDGGSQQLALFG